MSVNFLERRDAMIWRRVGRLACIMGAHKNDNPFRNYLSILDPERLRDKVIDRKLKAWDQGWDSVWVPRAAGRVRAYLPSNALPRLATLLRRTSYSAKPRGT